MFLYRFRDNEEDITNYESFIITREDVTELIEDSCFAWDDCLNFNSIEEFLTENGEELQYNKKVLDFLKNHKQERVDNWFKIDFVKDVLRENNIEIIEFEEKNIWY